MCIFIGGAWPYANGSLHLGHISSLLPGDILARYYRMKGEKVLFVSGSDCNGTPIAIKAKQENVSIKEISDHYHEEFIQDFNKLGFSYDTYSRTDSKLHHEVVKKIFLKLLNNNHLYKQKVEQCYCDYCAQFLPDRFVEGICPSCHKQARGDQCDFCSKILDPLDLLNKKCKTCGNSPRAKETEHFYFKLSSFQSDIEVYLDGVKNDGQWRDNAIQLTERYLKEGLHDRAATRDLPNGVSVPFEGYEDKKIYVWIEAVSGYYSASKQWELEHNKDASCFWGKDTKSYYIHGKDNIPFHSIIWPSILLGFNQQPLPTYIVSNEYLTIEQKKLSTSRNWAIWVKEILKRYGADSVRYFLTINAPEHRDADFSWREFIYSHNSELLGAYGNFVNRTLKFIEKSYESQIPKSDVNHDIKVRVEELYEHVGKLIEKAHFKEALEGVFNFIRYANKYFDEQKPWIQVNEEPTECKHTLLNCVYIIVNLSQLLEPFLPFSSQKIKDVLGLSHSTWEEANVQSTYINEVRPLFKRIDINQIDKELEALKHQTLEN
ncbi:methionine--tRNA ligase [Filobacillus milosensis]|uniref:Methionine--tRNA ligase n=1 Tax=Filobacillus milosensis TaxID=94137 RepID=A0A4Y8IQW4_9BACI|nr:methionine--tRNA ligase [Filobacillus milosensis]TFB24044.1 methionine--tRNA ligase [Filobacillus milosensis]